MRAEPDVVSPNILEAEELVGHEFASEEERLLAVREIVALGPSEAIMTMADGCVADVLIDGKSCLRRARTEPREPVANAARATLSSPATSPPAMRAARPTSACASASPVARSPPDGSAPG